MKALIPAIKITLQAIMLRIITAWEISESQRKNNNQRMKTFQIHTSKCLAQLLSKIGDKHP
jgi:hypothetical protein